MLAMLPITLIIFRLDSSFVLGSGHLQRCLTLANYAKKRRVESLFICRELKGNFNQLIIENGHQLLTIPSSQSVSQKSDAEETLELIKKAGGKPIAIVIDNYSLGLEFEQVVRSINLKIVVIDDLMNRQHDCDVLLDQNYKSDMKSAYLNLVPKNAKRFIGPSYTLMRPEFFEKQSLAKSQVDKIKNVLVFFGGSDPTGETLKFISEVTPKSKYTFHVLVTKKNKDLQKLKKLKNIKLHIEPNNIADIMLECDFYIGSGGTITWERMCMKLSGYVISVADNQVDGAVALAKDNLHWYLGTKEDVDYGLIIKKLEQQEKDLDAVNKQISKYQELFSIDKLNELIDKIIS